MFDHLLESSRVDDSNKWSNMGFDELSIIDIQIRILSGALNIQILWVYGQVVAYLMQQTHIILSSITSN